MKEDKFQPLMKYVAKGLNPEVNKILDDPISFLESKGYIFPKKLKELLDYLLEKADKKEIIRVIIKACRGGSKTMTCSAAEFIMWMRHDYDFVNLGGSKNQADRAYYYISDLISDPKISSEVGRTIQSYTEKKNGSWLRVLAASEKQTRSPHAGGKDMFKNDKGGGLFLDEEVEMEARIVNSSKPIVNTARPSCIIRASTLHKIYGSFQDTWDNADKYGYKKFEWNIFDVCEPCTRNCKKVVDKPYDTGSDGCYRDFAQDIYREDEKGNQVLVHKAYCGGAAKKTKGYVKMEEILQAWKETDRQSFEIEWMGWRPGKEGLVYDPQLIDDSIVQNYNIDWGLFKSLYKTEGIDWGFGSMAVRTNVFFRDEIAYVYRWKMYENIGTDILMPEIHNDFKNDNIEHIYPDAEEAYNNDTVKKKCGKENVTPIAFGKWKEWGIGGFNNRLESHTIKFIKCFNGVVNEDFLEGIYQLKNLRRDVKGKIIKKKDHFPDSAFLCLMKEVMDKAKEKKEPRVRSLK